MCDPFVTTWVLLPPGNTGFKTLSSAYFQYFYVSYSHRFHLCLSWAQKYFVCLIFPADQSPVVSNLFIYFIYLLYLTLIYKIVENNSTKKYQQNQIKIPYVI